MFYIRSAGAVRAFHWGARARPWNDVPAPQDPGSHPHDSGRGAQSNAGPCDKVVTSATCGRSDFGLARTLRRPADWSLVSASVPRKSRVLLAMVVHKFIYVTRATITPTKKNPAGAGAQNKSADPHDEHAGGGRRRRRGSTSRMSAMSVGLFPRRELARDDRALRDRTLVKGLAGPFG